MADARSDLELFSTDELLEELSHRHESCAFVGKPLVGSDESIGRLTMFLRGCCLSVLGLTSLLQREAMDGMIYGEDLAELDDEDE